MRFRMEKELRSVSHYRNISECPNNKEYWTQLKSVLIRRSHIYFNKGCIESASLLTHDWITNELYNLNNNLHYAILLSHGHKIQPWNVDKLIEVLEEYDSIRRDFHELAKKHYKTARYDHGWSRQPGRQIERRVGA